MASAKEKFKAQNPTTTTKEKVANARMGLDIKTPETSGDLATVEQTAIPTTVVKDEQPLTTDIGIAASSAVTPQLDGIYNAANTALDKAGSGAIASFESVTDRLALLLAPDVTVSQLRETIGGLSFEERNAQLAVLDEIENAQIVEQRKQEIQETQISIELKRIALQLQLTKGMIKNAISVEEIKDLENQLVTVQKENVLKQDNRNIGLSFLAGKNSIDQSRVANKLNFMASVDQRLTTQENDKLDHMDAIRGLHLRLFAATQKGYEAYVKTKEAKADAKVSLMERMTTAAKEEVKNA